MISLAEILRLLRRDRARIVERVVAVIDDELASIAQQLLAQRSAVPEGYSRLKEAAFELGISERSVGRYERRLPGSVWRDDAGRPWINVSAIRQHRTRADLPTKSADLPNCKAR